MEQYNKNYINKKETILIVFFYSKVGWVCVGYGHSRRKGIKLSFTNIKQY